MQEGKQVSWAEAGAIFYLTLPLFLFFMLYIRLAVALPACAFMLLCAIQLVRWVDWKATRMDWQTSVAIVSVCVVWIWLSGGWGDLRQNGDWVKHYAIINYLASQPNLSLFDASLQSREFLRYSIGWYVVPALAVRASAGHFQAIYSSAWTLVGLLLFFSNLRSLTRSGVGSIVSCCAFILFSGADIVGYAMTHLQPGPRFHLEGPVRKFVFKA